MNAVQFVACATFNSSPTAGEYAIEIHGADGMSFIACDIQNQGIYLNGCEKTTISGGYWEAYSVPAIKLVGGSTNIQGIFAPSATIFDVDSAAANQMYGEGLQSNIFFPSRPTMTQPVNIFPDPTASTVNAINALSYSPTGINFTASISGGNLQLTTTNILARSGFFIPLTTAASISIYVRWRALAGSVKIQTLNTTPSSQVASVAGDGFLTTRLAAVSNGGAPAIVFSPEGAGPTYTAEISDIYVAPSNNLFASPDGAIVSMSEVVERQLGYSTRTGGAAELAASAATDFTLGSATGLLMVKNALQTNADNVFTAEMFFVQITFSNNFIATSLSADNGVSGGCTFTVTSPSSGVVRITNTHAAATNLRYQFFGLNV